MGRNHCSRCSGICINTKNGIKALSAIKTIKAYKAPISVPEDKSDGIIVRLFRYSAEKLNKKVDADFELTLNHLECEWEKHRSESVRLYKVSSNIERLLERLPNIVTVQSAIVSNSIIIQNAFLLICVFFPLSTDLRL